MCELEERISAWVAQTFFPTTKLGASGFGGDYMIILKSKKTVKSMKEFKTQIRYAG